MESIARFCSSLSVEDCPEEGITKNRLEKMFVYGVDDARK